MTDHWEGMCQDVKTAAHLYLNTTVEPQNKGHLGPAMYFERHVIFDALDFVPLLESQGSQYSLVPRLGHT